MSQPDERRIQAERSCTAALETMKRLLDMDLGKDPRDFIVSHNTGARTD